MCTIGSVSGQHFLLARPFRLSRCVVLDIVIALRLIYARPLEKSSLQMLGGPISVDITPDLYMLSISGVSSTFHILVASGSFLAVIGRRGSA